MRLEIIDIKFLVFNTTISSIVKFPYHVSNVAVPPNQMM